MSAEARPIHRHALFKRQYRRAVAATAGFHDLTAARQWAALRAQVQTDATDAGSTLLETFDSRESRRDQVLAALEEGRQAHKQ
jgi:hypothetical protein